MAGPENMAEGPVNTEGGQGASGTAVAEKPDVVAPKTPKRDILGRIFGEGQGQPEVLVEPGTYRPPQAIQEPPPDQTPDQPDQGTIEGQEALDRDARARMVAEGGIPPPGGDEGGGGEDREPPRGPEWETSPERGREIVKEIIRLETTIPYTQRYRIRTGLLSTTNPEIYNERNGTYLDQLYKDLQDYTRALRRVRNQRDPWNPVIAYREIRRRLEAFVQGEQVPETQQVVGRIRERGERPPALPAELLNALFEKYKDDTNAEAVEDDLATWFQETRHFGLLDRADAFFTSFYRHLVQGDIPADQIEGELERAREQARRSIEGLFRGHRTDPRAAGLRGIAEAYSTRTYDIFELMLSGENYVPLEGEFRFGEDLDEEEDTEKYWRPGHYPKLYEIIAKTKRQFSRAKDSFLSMITRGSLGKSPDELYEHFNNFTEKFSQTASAEGIDDEYIMDSRLELGGRGFVFGGDYSLETYNPKSANQFLMAMALHEGPQRWVSVARSGSGGVGAHLWKFDYDPRVVLMHNPGGSRGQLLSDTVTQHYLHTQIRDILIEEGIGIMLKDYDPRDEESVAYADHSIKVGNTPEHEKAREQFLKANLERIGVHQTDSEFKELYEGFDRGDAHILNYQRYRDLSEKELKQRLSPSLRKSVTIGKVQTMLQGYEGKNRGQLLGVIDNLIAEGQLTEKDKRIWTEGYDQSKANFDTAFQMVGASGEKARRGGGVFFIDRKDEQGRKFVDNMPVYLAEKWVQYAVTRCKIQYANALAQDRTNAVAQARKHAIEQLKRDGFEAKLEVPKLVFDTDEKSPTFGDVIRTGDTETIDFDTAVNSIYSRWTNHTYWGYQQENRHMLTDPDVVKLAKKIRMGLATSEQEKENLAALLLIVDPTLKRVARLEDWQVREGESAMQQEIILFEAAVEASNQGHWTISRELNAVFMPDDGNVFKMRTGYNLEDYAGIARFIIRMRQYIAAHPKRFARRYAAEIANLPMNVSSMPDQWGQEGVLGAIEMFADPVGAMAEQREASQFAITKWVEQMRIGNMLFGALVGQVDSERGFSIEGLFEKPTANSDKLARYWEKLDVIEKYADAENEFFYALLETFDRLWTVLKLVRTMESDTRNAQGALDLEKKEIFIDGKVNPEISLDRNTGTSRHTERIFFDKYIDWLLSDKPGGGMVTYPSEVAFYKFLREPYFYFDGTNKVNDPNGRTWADWLFDKMSR